MVRKTVWTFVAAVMFAASAAAQTPPPAPPPAPRPLDRSDLRHQIYVMEGALARAVQFGAQQLNRELRNISPESVMLTGDAQARGVFLEGYGVFFDVGVPILRQSMMWSLRTILEQDDAAVKDSIALLRMQMSAERDPLKRSNIQTTIALLESQLAPASATRRAPQRQPVGQGVGAAMMPPETMPGAPAPVAPSVAAPPDPAGMNAADRRLLRDPNRAYTEAVQRALVDAMIDYAAPMLIGPDEWLTVAARDNEPRDSFAPQDPLEEVVTVLLRVKGADLASYRAGTIDRVEAKKRVQVREF